jgi:hypothetical protein
MLFYLDGNRQVEQGLVYLVHQSPAVPYASNLERNFSFSGTFYNRLADTLLEIPRSSYRDLYGKLAGGNLQAEFTTPDGASHLWKPGPSIGYMSYIVDWKDADPENHPEFREMHSRYDAEPKAFGYRFAVTADAAGNLVGIAAAPQDVNTLTPDQIIRLVLAPLAEVLTHRQIPAQSPNDFYFNDDVEGLFKSAQGKLMDPAYFIIVTK